MSNAPRSATAELEELRDALRQSLGKTEQNAEPVALDQPIGRLSRMDAIQQQQMTLANRQAVGARLVQIEAAIRRCEAGEYGDCGDCGEAIPPERLQARPEALFCVACQQARE